jgi:hypothetical protein
MTMKLVLDTQGWKGREDDDSSRDRRISPLSRPKIPTVIFNSQPLLDECNPDSALQNDGCCQCSFCVDREKRRSTRGMKA